MNKKEKMIMLPEKFVEKVIVLLDALEELEFDVVEELRDELWEILAKKAEAMAHRREYQAERVKRREYMENQ